MLLPASRSHLESMAMPGQKHSQQDGIASRVTTSLMQGLSAAFIWPCKKERSPDDMADFDLPALVGREPIGNVRANDTVLKFHISPQRLPREQRKE